RPVDSATSSNLSRLAMVGTSRLRRILARSNYSPQFAEQMGAVTALTGRIVDLSANWTPPSDPLSGDDRARMQRLAKNLATICDDLLAGKAAHLGALPPIGEASSALPVISELERLVSLIPGTFVGPHPLNAYLPPPSSGEPPQRLFAWDTR